MSDYDKQIEEAAEDIWINKLEMSEPRYCANGSWGYFVDGFKFGANWQKQKDAERIKELDHLNAVLTQKCMNLELELKEASEG